VSELDELDPRAEEEAELVNRRAVLANRERLVDGLRGALAELEREPGVDGSLRQVQRQLERIAEVAPGELNEALAALERAAIETEEALHALQAVADNVEHDETRLESVEERLFSLRDAARKHDVAIGALPALLQDLKQQLAAVDDEGDTLQRLDQESAASREVFERSAKKLSRARHKAAVALDKAVNAELPPLRLERARFRTRLEALDETRWGANGIDRIGFEASTNPGMPMAPLARIASGGELARFMLAIKVVLAGVGACPTLIFDEVDAGIGGATADAVGERLARLAESRQVLVVTHSPQVAARGHQHLRVTKVPGTDGSVNGDDPVLTRVHELSTDERHEEIARMLSGARITTQARAAAASLIGSNGE
jgi:DNA repair protein RecN (Recombination protein N)